MKVTKEDIKLLEGITKGFSKNLKDSYKQTHGKDAVEEFTKNASKRDIFNIFSARVALKTPSFSDRARAKKEIRNCMAALPALKKTFGEQALVAALPKEAASQRVIEICEQLGGREMAALCQNKMKPGK
jgi:hypothetical protein